MKIIPLSVCLALLTGLAAAQKVPRFAEYSTKVERPRITSIDFKKNPDARTYRTPPHGGVEEWC